MLESSGVRKGRENLHTHTERNCEGLKKITGEKIKRGKAQGRAKIACLNELCLIN